MNKIVDGLVEECSQNIDENEMIYNGTLNAIPLNDYKKVCNSCTLYIVLFAIFLIISTTISIVFIYFPWYLKEVTLKQYFIECNSIEYINDNFQKKKKKLI